MPQRSHVWCGTCESSASTVQDAGWFPEKTISENKKQQRGGFHHRRTSTVGPKGKKNSVLSHKREFDYSTLLRFMQRQLLLVAFFFFLHENRTFCDYWCWRFWEWKAMWASLSSFPKLARVHQRFTPGYCWITDCINWMNGSSYFHLPLLDSVSLWPACPIYNPFTSPWVHMKTEMLLFVLYL